MIFNKPYEQRLESWVELRDSLEDSEEPFREVWEAYQQAPLGKLNADPWDETSWLDPWQLIFENQYCEFSRVLGVCYSLQLTERFKTSEFEIHIITDNNLGYLYLLYVDDTVLGFDDGPIHISKLSKEYRSQQVHKMNPIQ